jgi:multicomponent Na+:H+ antiporter subunit A
MSLSLPIIVGAFAGAAIAPWTLGRLSAHALALVPVAIVALLFAYGSDIIAAGGEATRIPWVESLGVGLSFRIDAFALLFATLIAGIGALVVLYAASYLAGEKGRLAFIGLILAFMAAMLGAVFSNDVILFFVFWEITSVLSFLLIGFKSENGKARRSAIQALLVTGGGGLSLLAGLLILASLAGTTEFTGIVAAGEEIAASPLFPAALLLVLGGAFTKSAQVPFQFWLGNAMAAPTPASAYLHSATMVKLGVYLLIVLDPAFGHTELWQTLLIGFGGATMLVAAIQALRVESFKAVLAQTTVVALGTLTLLVGIDDPVAAVATVGFFLSHALYKAALFFVAGNAIHATGVERLSQMRGLFRALPLTAVAAVVASLSMAGLPPFIGFISKELLFEAKLATGVTVLLVIAVVVNAIMVAVAAVIALRPFFGRVQEPATLRHRERFGLVAGPIILAGLGALFGIAPGLASSAILSDAAAAAAGGPVYANLKLWHGLTPMLGLSALAIGTGALLAWQWRPVHDRLAAIRIPAVMNSERIADGAGNGVLSAARILTGAMQNGSLRRYTLIPIAATTALLVYALARSGVAVPAELTFDRPYLFGVAAVIVLGSLLAALSRSFLAVLIGVGLVGYALGFLFLKQGAPDLAFTQFAIETIFVVIATAIVLRLPHMVPDARTVREKRLDGALSVGFGAVAALVLLGVMAAPFDQRVSDYFRLASLAEAYGRNVVNVIIVDFRALDTLGEIAVVALAALGAFGLMRGLRARTRRTLP